MKKRALYKLSHFRKKNTNIIEINVYVIKEHHIFGLERALFLADVQFEKTKEPIIFTIQFKRYKQLTYIIPIINEYLNKTLDIKTFYWIDKECKTILK